MIEERTVRRLLDRVEILEALYAYCRHADGQNAKAMTDLFTEDCRVSYHAGGDPTYVGREALYESRRMSLAAARSGSHHITNAELVWERDDQASGHFYMYSWQRFVDPLRRDCHRWGRYECRFVRTPEGWRISRLQLVSAGEYGGDRIAEHLGRAFPPRFN